MIFNMNFELRNELANFGTKLAIFWQKFCEIDCNNSDFNADKVAVRICTGNFGFQLSMPKIQQFLFQRI